MTITKSDITHSARRLAAEFATDAVERDRLGGTPKKQRDALRNSGLLAMLIPEHLGGLGCSWQDIFAVTREFARTDSSIAHVFGFHHLQLATVRLFARQSQWQPWFAHTASRNWFWGNAMNALDARLIARRHQGWYEFSGQKSFCSGAPDSEMLIAAAMDEESPQKMTMAVIPSSRTGITLHEDWNNIGQRQTDSGSVTFERVRVETDELLRDPGPLSSPFACLRQLISHLHFSNLFLGITEGAFAEARQYTRKESRPWPLSPAVNSDNDPFILRHYGEFWVQLESTRLLVERANSLLDSAWNKGLALTASERGHLALAIATAKVAATRHGLAICSALFDVTGARATNASLGLDRYWRNLRTQTLHDPVDYRIYELGQWALNEQFPTPSFYS
ncbi:acyl-CoA dehydrogenase family protein [Klebsiella sp. BIGb0407]|uniref:acyl-CoA dehydrogenase family protein n=1 Tax=Klebsiella sp. BIGb0407 TaxID=2940603 RepID=UPI0021699152|nr:acyl-CoA dehydrogenase family protein [Klebsiella sp. BIGb0407]MCS3429864.1 alkylation response protein AidB-like acyl-CoA dehydrogenase [Klebsiella sp. BIGb0407]